MKRSIKLAAAFILWIGISYGFADLVAAQDKVETESKFLTIGDISKIDLKTKTLTISYATSYNIGQLENGGGVSSAPGGRGGAGGVTVRGGGGGGRGGGGRRGNGGGGTVTGRTASAPIPMDFKVILSPKTIIKDGSDVIKFDDLKIGDHLQVFSMKGGTKLDAAEVMRTPKEDR